MVDVGVNNKTIFVLDHTQYFSISSGDLVSLEPVRTKPLTGVNEVDTDNILPSFSKSLWTCSVEAAVEYCRIVYDLFPNGKFVRFFVSDTVAHIVNTWSTSTQNTNHVLNAMSLVGIPSCITPSTDFSVIHGLRAAVEALSEPTEDQLRTQQMDYRHKFHAAAKKKIFNKGRIICITSARDDASIKSLEEIFHSVLGQQNKMAAGSKKALIIDHCNLVIINVYPLNTESLVADRGKVFLSPTLSTEIFSTSAPNISNKLTHLIMSHYDLASTTVTGIPMKEEQNANSSANYDVEILHSRNAHTVFMGTENFLPTSIKSGAEYETVTLKWSTPRSCGSCESQQSLAQHRVTPVDVTSRPSACLINFLLNGRSVLLEMPRKTCGKSTSHLLSARGGEIFIHALQFVRTCIEDIPAITELAGGRLSDYRLSEFCAMAKAHHLVPHKNLSKTDENLYHARQILFQSTRYFPLTYSSTIVFNLQRTLPWLEMFLQRCNKPDMDKSDEVQCQQYLFDLYTSSRRVDSLPPLPYLGCIRGNKKVIQYKLIWAELEIILRCIPANPHHRILLDGLRAMYMEDIRIAIDYEHTPLSQQTSTIPTDSPMSPPSSTTNTNISKNSKRRSLYDIFLSYDMQITSKRFEFKGRTNYSHVLYENIKKEEVVEKETFK
ncbi:protein asunder [Teleopsis dalmanni]|uniref:protein asunder n=1 Tax=Teleopsis dalmanni TaxID=139649 RepID=UPI0018CD79E9|nr:protein asunder [Teleopsis dalmanni]